MLIQDVGCELLNRRWESRRKKQRLSVRPYLVDNRAQLVLETHIEHLVSLIDDQECASRRQRESSFAQKLD